VLEFLHHLAGVRKSSCLELGEHKLVIRQDIKDAIGSGDQLRLHT